MTGTINPPIPQIGEQNELADPVIKESLEELRDALNAILTSENKLDPAKISEIANTALKSAKVTHYSPKAISTEESRENTSYSTLTTADEIKSIVIPENGTLFVNYYALWKGSSATEGIGQASLYLGETRLDDLAGEKQGTATAQTEFRVLTTTAAGLTNFKELPGPSTSHILGVGLPGTYNIMQGETGRRNEAGVTAFALGGFVPISAAAGTYDLSVKFKTVEGSKKVTVKSRILRAYVVGS
jgi:hypothetical protein